MKGLLLLAALAAPAAGYETHHEGLEVLGWNKACSVAVARYGYPWLGDWIVDDPIWSRVRAHTIRPESAEQEIEDYLGRDGAKSWNKADDEEARAAARGQGYSLPGYRERLGHVVAPERDLPRLILSTDTFRSPTAKGWPAPHWKLHEVRYSPLPSHCALLVFKDSRQPRDYFELLLIRVGNPTARQDRAVSRATNARLLLVRGELELALAEAEAAAEMAPEMALTRFHHAALLNLSGKVEEAVAELAEAVRLDPAMSRKAREDKDFANLRRHPEFRKLTGRSRGGD